MSVDEKQDVVWLDVSGRSTDAELIDFMRVAKRHREVGSKHVILTVNGYDDDPRELHDIPECRAICRRIERLGLISFLDLTTTAVGIEDADMVNAALGALEVILIADDRRTSDMEITPLEWDQFRLRIAHSNSRADKLLGPMRTPE